MVLNVNVNVQVISACTHVINLGHKDDTTRNIVLALISNTFNSACRYLLSTGRYFDSYKDGICLKRFTLYFQFYTSYKNVVFLYSCIGLALFETDSKLGNSYPKAFLEQTSTEQCPMPGTVKC